MLIYLLKFSTCLFIFLLFYKLVLENERMHNLKRYYLLVALVLSICIPLVTFTEYVEPVVSTITIIERPQFSFEPEVIVQSTLLDYLPLILWSIYGLGILVFGLKFGLNLTHIVKKIKQNPKLKSNRFITVLLNDTITPHTFFSYIFLNKHKYETQQIPKEVFIHEQTHAKQKHSIDILIIELFQVVLWFNPLIYLTKHAIKLNHEFLADEAVLKQGIEPSIYQQLLLAFSSNASEPQMANAINYSSIKKRFTVMKTHTSKQKIWLRSILLLPLVALTLYGFSKRNIIEKEQISKEENKISVLKSNPILEISFNPDVFKLNGKETSLSQLKEDFATATNNEKSDLNIKTVGGIKMSLITKIMNELKGNLIKINLDEAAFIIGDTSTNEYQENATPEELTEYNKLAKHYNTQPKEKRVVKLKDLKRLESIYNKMSKEQKASAEPFPDCPPPPPAPPVPDAPKVIKGKDVPPPPPIPANATPEQKKKMQAAVDDYNNKVPPPPPPPKSPLDHVIEMAKKGAAFYYEGKSISSDEAIALLKKNKELNISTKQVDSKEPKVYISKEPIVINKKHLPKPTANNAINHLKVMNRHDAIFYLDNTEVTFEEALKAVRKNKNSDISSTITPPVVNITNRLTGVLGKS